MKNVSILKIIFLISFSLALAYHVYAECYNEDACFKDYVTTGGNDVVIAVNRETGQVDLVWSDKDQTWLKPGEDQQADLQKVYSKKVQLRGMQQRLDRMNRDTLFTTNQAGSGRR